MTPDRPLRVGVISDTHNLVRPSAKAFLAGCDHIIHAGDICRAEVLIELAAIAPVTAVRGNNDQGPWAHALREEELLDIGGVRFYVVHDIAQSGIDAVSAGMGVVISGHSHKPRVEMKGPVVYLNPGSAGPRRFTLPISIAEVIVADGVATARCVQLEES